jgi:glycosyl transferase family 2
MAGFGLRHPLITGLREDFRGRDGDASTACGGVSTLQRPRAEGKFLYLGPEKFFVRGVAYGAFPPNSQGDQFPEPSGVARDLALMKRAGINAILTYTVPPPSLLDQALANGIRAIVTVPWMEYVCFLEDRGSGKRIRRQVKEGIASCRRHPAVLMYCVGKEIPPPIVRWHGRRKVEVFLRDLYQAAKDEAPDSLVTYTNYPTTEYLELPFVDVYTFNVYLHHRRDFCAYLSRLQNLAGELPVVLTEFGKCSFRHGREGQSAFLDWQLEEIFDHGLAGAVIFGWTDPFFQDGSLIDEWGFGLVDANRCPKPSYAVARRRFTKSIPFAAERQWPRVSVVVATHNGARTLDDCLNSLRSLRYPDYEVIVVNDGSTDNSETIIQRYPFRAITTPKSGVGAARNEGMRAATGEIIAYIDSDARADPEWLSYLVVTFLESDVVGVGGPNLVSPRG